MRKRTQSHASLAISNNHSSSLNLQLKVTMVKYSLLIAALAASNAAAFSAHNKQPDTSRRSLLGGAFAGLLVGAAQQPALAEEEVKWDVFNGLIYNYRGNGFNGLDASTLDEPSIPFLEFGDRLTKNEVAFVEFLAPDGDVAYATFTGEDEKNKRIRIGEGFPIEQHDGYSSPMFVVRALNNKNVPYKFVVAGLEKYK